MKRLSILLTFAILLFGSCSTNYYLVVSDTETPVYSTLDGFETTEIIPAGRAFVHSGNYPMAKTNYGKRKGYTYRRDTWKSLTALKKKEYRSLRFTSDFGFVSAYIPTSAY